jgi:hypothetical protein
MSAGLNIPSSISKQVFSCRRTIRKALAEALKEGFSCPEKYKALCENAIKRVNERFTWTFVAQKAHQLYAKVIAHQYMQPVYLLRPKQVERKSGRNNGQDNLFMQYREHAPAKAVFLDKDGTLVRDVPYNVDPEKVVFETGVWEGLLTLQADGYKLVIISNQPGLEMELFSQQQLDNLILYFNEVFEQNQLTLSGFYYCPHEACF